MNEGRRKRSERIRKKVREKERKIEKGEGRKRGGRKVQLYNILY